MRQIAYLSTATAPQTSELLHQMLAQSRKNNRAREITGMLLAGGDRYLQVIEGRRETVDALFQTIRNDPRHFAVTSFLNRRMFRRTFDGWSMAFRSEPTLGGFDRYPDVVRFLTSRIDDDEVRHQVRRFADLLIAPPAEGTSRAWPIAS